MKKSKTVILVSFLIVVLLVDCTAGTIFEKLAKRWKNKYSLYKQSVNYSNQTSTEYNEGMLASRIARGITALISQKSSIGHQYENNLYINCMEFYRIQLGTTAFNRAIQGSLPILCADHELADDEEMLLFKDYNTESGNPHAMVKME